jgi:hypothetical protein
MKHLATRVSGLERKSWGPALHIVAQRTGQTKEEALAAYGKSIAASDTVIIVSRRPRRAG